MKRAIVSVLAAGAVLLAGCTETAHVAKSQLQGSGSSKAGSTPTCQSLIGQPAERLNDGCLIKGKDGINDALGVDCGDGTELLLVSDNYYGVTKGGTVKYSKDEDTDKAYSAAYLKCNA